MRFELSFLERGYYANRLRARAVQLRLIAEQRSASASVQDLHAEIAYLESEAQRLDNAEEPPTVSEKEPIRVEDNRDVTYIDGAGTNGKARA